MKRSAQEELIRRLFDGDIAAAVGVLKATPGEILSDVGPETVADAMMAAFVKVEAAAGLEPPHDLEALVRTVRKDVTAIVQQARRRQSPEDLVGLVFAVAVARGIVEHQIRSRGEE